MTREELEKRLRQTRRAIEIAEGRDWYGEVISLKIQYDFYFNQWFDISIGFKTA